MFWIGFIIGFASSIPWRTIQLNSETNLTRNYALEQYQEGILQTNILPIIVIIIMVITTIIIIVVIIIVTTTTIIIIVIIITSFSFDFMVVYSFSSLRIFFWLIWLQVELMMMMMVIQVNVVIFTMTLISC